MSAYEQGKAAFFAGTVRDANPYQVGTVQREEWLAGWQAAHNAIFRIDTEQIASLLKKWSQR